MTGLRSSQLARLTMLGANADGETIVIRCGGPSEDSCGGVHRARYVVDLEREGEVVLIPLTRGHEASSDLPEDSYEYSHGGCVFQSAVDAAKELAAAFGV